MLSTAPHHRERRSMHDELTAYVLQKLNIHDDRQHAVAEAVTELREAYTPKGVVDWFHRPHPQLTGRAPVDVLADPDHHQRVLEVARGSRESTAS